MFSFDWKSLFDFGAAEAAMEQAGQDLVREMAEFVLDRARAYAPIDTSYLVAHIEMVAPQGLDAHVISTAFYSSYVEFGHMANGTWVPPNPFMRRALADARDAFPSIASGVSLAAPQGRQVSSMLAGLGRGETGTVGGFLGVSIPQP